MLINRHPLELETERPLSCRKSGPPLIPKPLVRGQMRCGSGPLRLPSNKKIEMAGHTTNDVASMLLLRSVANRKTLFLAVFVFLSTLSAAVVFSLTPQYESVTLLMGGQPDLDRTQNDGRRATDSGISIAAMAEST
ncbi:MAG: hypothetical protein ABW003_07055, partial [Microvirga sp.]